jgi:imidazolonepropionase-like amidohydrolase
MWQDVSREFTTKLPAPARATLRSLFALQLSLVKPFKAAGVKMLTGSDTGGGFVIPGFSLHQEFDLLEEAGLAPLDVLQMTTLNGAQFLGRESTMGSVDEGKDADLVLLTDDPLVSVQNLHNISAVVHAGVYHSAADLDGMKKKTERRAATGNFAAFTGAPCGCTA